MPFPLPAHASPPLPPLCGAAALREESLLREINREATVRFMHLIAPHPDTGAPPAASCLAVILPACPQ